MKRSTVMTIMATGIALATSGEVEMISADKMSKQMIRLYEKMAVTKSNGVSVAFNVPETLVMWHEFKMPITITVSNGTENAIPFMRDKNVASRMQLWIDLGDKYQFVHPPKFGLTREKQWDAANGFDQNTWPADLLLNPGESASWELKLADTLEILDYASEMGTSNITARVQLGIDQWASSETRPFHVVPRSLEYVADTDYWAQYKVAEFEYIITERGAFDIERKKTKKAPFFVIPIKGKRTLLDYKSNEICVLQGEELPEFKFDKEAETVSIALPNRKQIRYNLKNGKVEPDDNPK